MVQLLFLGGMFSAFLTVYLLLFNKNETKSYSDYLLAILFVLHIYCALLYLLIYSGFINSVPYLYKTGAPINFILPPLSYLYVRAVLYNEKGFSKWDIVHYIPFILFSINYIPFYLIPIIEKAEIVKAIVIDQSLIYKNNAGIIPEYVLFVLRLLQTIIYLVFNWILVIKYRKKILNKQVQDQITSVIKWLKLFNWTGVVNLGGLILLILLVLVFKGSFILPFLNLIPGLIIALSFFVISSYLLVNPQVLFGLPFVKYTEVPSGIVEDHTQKIHFITEDYSKEIEHIRTYILEHKPYLKSSININQVSVELGIPARELSFILNNHFGLRFNDFVNNHRITYVTERLNPNYLKNYTIETLSLEAGFTSKSTFNAAFKKVHNCTPSEYLSNSF
jgi:AraC-like DNA-binding protein